MGQCQVVLRGHKLYPDAILGGDLGNDSYIQSLFRFSAVALVSGISRADPQERVAAGALDTIPAQKNVADRAALVSNYVVADLAAYPVAGPHDFVFITSALADHQLLSPFDADIISKLVFLAPVAFAVNPSLVGRVAGRLDVETVGLGVLLNIFATRNASGAGLHITMTARQSSSSNSGG